MRRLLRQRAALLWLVLVLVVLLLATGVALAVRPGACEVPAHVALGTPTPTVPRVLLPVVLRGSSPTPTPLGTRWPPPDWRTPTPMGTWAYQ